MAKQYNPTGKEKKIKTMVEKRYKEAKAFFVKYHKDRYDKYYKNANDYNGDRLELLKKVGGDDWMSNLFVPITASHIRTIHPRVIGGLPSIMVSGRNQSSQKGAIKIQAMLEYLWERNTMKGKIKILILDAINYGIGIGKVIWDKGIVKGGMTKINDDGESEFVPMKFDEYDDPGFEPVDPYSYFHDPLGTTIDNCRYHFQRYLLTADQIQANYAGLIEHNIEIIKSKDKSIDRGDLTNYASVRKDILEYKSKESAKNTSTSRDGGSQVTFGNKADVTDDIWEVVEYWENDAFVLKAGGVILRYGDNPYPIKRAPFIRLVYEEKSFEFEGKGVPEQLEHIQEAINSIRNKRIDNTTLSINKMFIVNPGSLIAKEDLVSRPFGIIRSPDPNAVVPLDFGTTNESAYREDDIIEKTAKTATGIDDFSRGIGGAASQTATSVQTQKESTFERVKNFIDNMEEAYSKIIRLWFGLARLYPIGQVQRIVGEEEGMEVSNNSVQRDFKVTRDGVEEFPVVSEGDLYGLYDFKVLSNASIAGLRDLEKAKALEFLDRAVSQGTDPLTQQQIPNLRAIWEKVSDVYGYDNSEMLNPNLEESIPNQEILNEEQQVQDIDNSRLAAEAGVIKAQQTGQTNSSPNLGSQQKKPSTVKDQTAGKSLSDTFQQSR